MSQIENAKITKVSLGKEDHGILTFWIFVDYGEGVGQGIGGYALDSFDKKLNKRVASPKSLDLIATILDVVGVDTWEELPGKYIRVVNDGWGSTVKKFGNVLKDKWLDIPKFFEEELKNAKA